MYTQPMSHLNSHRQSWIQEALAPNDYNMIVTPKEIDFLIDKLSEVISRAIDKSLHDAINQQIVNQNVEFFLTNIVNLHRIAGIIVKGCFYEKII